MARFYYINVRGGIENVQKDGILVDHHLKRKSQEWSVMRGYVDMKISIFQIHPEKNNHLGTHTRGFARMLVFRTAVSLRCGLDASS